MTGKVLNIEAPGLMSTIQDVGRFGYQRFGISTSGASDQGALRLGNLLLGNDAGAAAVEITFGGFAAVFTAATAFALSGGDLSPTLNGTPVATGVVYMAVANDRLTMAAPVSGFRSYLHLPGGVVCEQVLGSAATYQPAHIGGIDGRALIAGDELAAGEPSRVMMAGTTLDFPVTPPAQTPQPVRVLLGPQDDHFTARGIRTFLDEIFTVTDRSNRQGVRLDGPEVEAEGDSYDIVSDAVVTGSIQIPGDRKPIILMSDRQTTGGYPKIAVVVTVDLPLIAQAAPSAQIQFVAISREDAVALLGEQEVAINNISVVAPDLRELVLTVDLEAHHVGVPGHRGEQQASRFQIELDGNRHTVAIENIE